MKRQPVAYIRRSTADADSNGDVSRAVQESTVRALAERDGFDPDDLHIYVDWAKSAAEEKSDKRIQYAAMLKRIEVGEVCCVYAYALDRLNRSLVLTARFAKACEAADVKIVTHREGEVRQDTSAEWLRWTILATFGEYELRTIKTRAASALDERRRRGDKLGQPPYGYRFERVDGRLDWVRDPDRPIEPLLQAYREKGTILGACRLLEERGIPAPKGGTRWATSALTRIIEREAPELLPRRTATGKRTPSRARLAGLLRCPFCDRLLTPNIARGQYYCANGARDRANHPRYAVREVDILPWVQAEADRFDPGDYLEAEGVEKERAAIVDRRERALELYLAKDPMMTPERYRAEQDRAQRELDALDTRGSLAAIPPHAVDWGAEPTKINAFLRSIFIGIDLDRQLLPVHAEWRVPEYRTAG